MISTRDKFYEEQSEQCIINGKKVRWRIFFEDGFFENDIRINGIRVLMVKGERGEAGTTDYTMLENIPTLNGVSITGDKTATDYNFHPVAMSGRFEDLTQESIAIIDCGTATEVI